MAREFSRCRARLLRLRREMTEDFYESMREVEPLYISLKKESELGRGASLALERLDRSAALASLHLQEMMAIRSQPQFAQLRVVVEKVLLHHGILREMSRAGFLKKLTFIGGTCLRACYGLQRLSEDLDLTGGAGFIREGLEDLGRVLVEYLEIKYI